MQEESLVKTIVTGADWQEVLSNIIIDQNMDPLNIDIIKLSTEFMDYVNKLKDFDFRVPARFILIAAILLTMKCEKVLEKEDESLRNMQKREFEQLDIDVPLVMPPIKREPTRKVTLTELISAMSKVLDIKDRKERIIPIERKAPEIIIEDTEDIEKRIEKIYSRLKEKGFLKFSDLVPIWKRKEIINMFIPMLSLYNRGLIDCEQDEMFKDIDIKLR